MQIVSLLLVALAVSLDSFSVGFTYGLRKMKIPLKAIIVIACCSGAVMFLSMLIGGFLTKFFPVYVTEKLGGLILVGIGAWVLYQFFRPTKEQDYLLHEKTLLNLEVKSLGIVIHILRKPTSADIDRSGTINGIEALLLGFALSIDAFGAGIGAAILGFSPITLSFAVAIMSSLFVSIGIYAGHVLSKWSWIDKMAFLPGLLLITIGLWKL
ncbi:sporulation membrane protein YtaF [Bacillus atrophaeus]|uniref:sporulation membrane protein YtaF n=1 Tax=Bacillus atrophaeus TaxID=1452 RepID=UPI001C627993|nr:sporulation membrane protein YtaF [Bacillus atrophaeus]MCY7947040.1 sporulation membrane protein YtaF [Bacillus atrophaeus]MCY8096660.1 sporulation membrane protein YtaF [Bacillus atrophaeus]MCY8463878.1 sporulation membrane protein YtaF [Bacillus atrophaeus]MCY8476918.1 sporulation membrane protein YtaF [Bacillus atrophaeus]MCY8484077.1 sporulation membrane protein YtaF [Bacillus atrophaeus]